MSRIIRSAARSALMLSVVLALGVTGCGGTKTGGGGGGGGGKPPSSKGGGGGGGKRQQLSEDDKARLDEARQAAEAAEKKLSELRLERIQLEGGGQ